VFFFIVFYCMGFEPVIECEWMNEWKRHQRQQSTRYSRVKKTWAVWSRHHTLSAYRCVSAQTRGALIVHLLVTHCLCIKPQQLQNEPSLKRVLLLNFQLIQWYVIFVSDHHLSCCASSTDDLKPHWHSHQPSAGRGHCADMCTFW